MAKRTINHISKNKIIMKKFLLLAASAVAVMTVHAQTTVVLSDVANYIDFQALKASDAQMTQTTVTSTNHYTMDNGSELVGFKRGDDTEAPCNWAVKDDYNYSLPTPTWEGVDTLIVGTMWRAASGASIVLGAFETTADGPLSVYYQPNGDSERGVQITVKGEVVTGTCLTGSGIKIDGVRPCYAGTITLPKGSYDAGDVVITTVVNTSNIFGVGIYHLPAPARVNNIQSDKVQNTKVMRDGKLFIESEGKTFNALGIEAK